MSRMQSKIIWNMKKQENMTLFQEKRQPTEVNYDVKQMLELVDKDFKVISSWSRI